MTLEETETRIKDLEKETESITEIMNKMADIMRTMNTNIELINEILGNNLR